MELLTLVWRFMHERNDYLLSRDWEKEQKSANNIKKMMWKHMEV